jgi:ATP-dependent Zn protease
LEGEGMDKVWWWVMDVILPVILLIILLWLVFMRRSNKTSKTTFEGTKAEYADEEQRRREGTDDL